MMQKARVSDVVLAYEIHGEGPWVVFIHGGGLDRREWIPQVPVLSESYRVLTYDMRGQGESDVPETGYTPDQDAEDLIALFGVLGITSAHLVGLSYGSALAQRIAVEHPGLVRSLTLSGGQPPQRLWTRSLRKWCGPTANAVATKAPSPRWPPTSKAR